MASRRSRCSSSRRVDAAREARRAAPGPVVDAARALGERDVVVEVVGQLGEGRPHPLAPHPAARDGRLEREVDGARRTRAAPTGAGALGRGGRRGRRRSRPGRDRTPARRSVPARRGVAWRHSAGRSWGDLRALHGRPAVPASSRARDDHDRQARSPGIRHSIPPGVCCSMDHIIIGGVAGRHERRHAPAPPRRGRPHHRRRAQRPRVLRQLRPALPRRWRHRGP